MSYLTEIDNLVSQYFYPSELGNLLKDVCEMLFSSNNVKSIILSGSVPRGDFSYYYHNNEIKLLSDIELFVVVKEINKKEIKQMLDKINEIEIEVSQKSRLFHIDVSFLDDNKINKLPAWLQFWEIAQDGMILGKKIRVSQKPLDYRYLNEFSLNRLEKIVFYFPKEIFFEQQKKDRLIEFNYVLHRTLLDIPTWLLPYEGYVFSGLLIRAKFVLENCGNIKFLDFLPEFFLDLLAESIRVKKKPALVNGRIEDKLNMVLECYERSLKYVFFKLGINSNKDPIIDILNYSNILFDEFIFRRKLFELFLMLTNLKNLFNFKWLLLRKKGLIIAFLLNMNFSLLFYLKRDEKKWNYLENAEEILRKLNFNKSYIGDSDFIYRWLKLRAEYINFLSFFYRFYKIKKRYLLKIIQ